MRTLALLMVAAVGVAGAQGKKRQAVKGPVVLEAQPILMKGVSAFPRVKSGVAKDVAARINASLAKLDASVLKAARECKTTARFQPGPVDDEPWQRTVEVTMQGPGFLSIVAQDGMFCGGAHPDDGTLAMVYDLQTGRPVDWVKLLPAGARGVLSNSGDGATTGVVEWGALAKLAVAHADKDCKEAFAGGTPPTFSLWPDARTGAIMVGDDDLPHAMAPCKEAFAVSAVEARKLGVAAVMVDALEAAKALQ